MGDKMKNTDETLNAFFSAAKAEAPDPSAAFIAQMAQAALDEQPRAALRDAPGFWVQLRQTLGGWPGIAGLVAASVAGVFIGVSPPESLLSIYDFQSAGAESLNVDPLSGFDLTMLEG